MIYAIQAVGLDLVKIGKAKDPEARLKMLQTGSAVPLHLVASVAWSDLHEGMIHRRFAKHRRLGEWFEITDEIDEFVQVMICPNSTEQKKFEVAMQMLSEKQASVVDKSRKADRHAKVRTEYFREQKRKRRAEQKAA